MRVAIESAIKEEIVNIFGRRIVSSRDCIQLSDEIFHKTKLQLNPNTLRRFFGLVKAVYPPSHSTLTILSKYCGFQSVDEVAIIRNDNYTEEDALVEGTLQFLVSLFKDVPVTDSNDRTFLSVVINTVNFLNRHPKLTDKFQSQVAKTKNGLEFYFEKFVNIDKLNSYYGNGLRYYYAEKRVIDSQLFAHSLLIFRYWLTGENESLNHHYKFLEQQKVSNSVTPFIYGRYLAAQLYHAHAFSLPAGQIVQLAYSYYSSVSKESAAASFPRYELYLAEALVLTGYPEEALYYIGQAKKNYTEKDDYAHWKFFQNFILLETIAHVKLQTDKVDELFDQINSAEFYFLRKLYSTTLYLLLVAQLKKQNQRHDEQLKALISETGFTKLYTLF
jgi:hypothetical protein